MYQDAKMLESIRKVEAMMETNSSFRNAVNDIIHTVKEK